MASCRSVPLGLGSLILLSVFPLANPLVLVEQQFTLADFPALFNNRNLLPVVGDSKPHGAYNMGAVTADDLSMIDALVVIARNSTAVIQSSRLDTEVVDYPSYAWRPGYEIQDLVASGGLIVNLIHAKYNGPAADVNFDVNSKPPWDMVTSTGHRWNDPKGLGRHAFIALIGDAGRYVLLIGGWSAYGTRAAGTILKNYSKHADLLRGRAVVFVAVDDNGNGVWEEGESLITLEHLGVPSMGTKLVTFSPATAFIEFYSGVYAKPPDAFAYEILDGAAGASLHLEAYGQRYSGAHMSAGVSVEFGSPYTTWSLNESGGAFAWIPPRSLAPFPAVESFSLSARVTLDEARGDAWYRAGFSVEAFNQLEGFPPKLYYTELDFYQSPYVVQRVDENKRTNGFTYFTGYESRLYVAVKRITLLSKGETRNLSLSDLQEQLRLAWPDIFGTLLVTKVYVAMEAYQDIGGAEITVSIRDLQLGTPYAFNSRTNPSSPLELHFVLTAAVPEVIPFRLNRNLGFYCL